MAPQFSQRSRRRVVPHRPLRMAVRRLFAEGLEDRRMLHVLSTGSGDGSVTVTVDGFGSFGSAVFLDDFEGAIYDPIGPIPAASTTFQSGIAIRSGATGQRQFLTSGDILGSGDLTDPVTSGSSTTATSAFTIGGVNVALTQSVVPLIDSNNVQTGSILIQSYVMTNSGASGADFEIVRYIDGDLLFDGSLFDGGGRLLLPAEFLFETDAGGSGATDTTFLGIDAGGGTIPTVGRFEVDSFSGLGTRIIAGNALDGIITGDSNGDGFVDTGEEYDITLALRNVFSISPGQSATYTTRTIFGSGAPEDIPVNESQIEVADISQLEGDSGITNFVFNVALTQPANSPVVVRYSTEDITAVAPADYIPASGSFTFQPGGPTSQAVTIQVVGDLDVEDDESFRLLLVDELNGAQVESEATATILNDDVELSINDVSVVEGHSGSRDAVFTVSATGVLNQQVRVTYSTAANTAFAPVDYLGRNAVLVLPPGSSSGTIRVPVVGDSLNENNETFFVVLSAAQGARISRSVGTATILDDDPLPNLYVSDVVVTTTVAGSYAAVFAVALDRPSGREVTAQYSTADGTAAAGVQYQPRSGQVVFPAGVTTQLVSVPVTTDGLFGPNRKFFLDLLSTTYALTIDPRGAATIVYAPDTLGEYIIDDGEPGYSRSGNWTSLTNTLAYHLDYDYAPAGNSSATATWNFVGIPNGSYQVFARWSHFGNRATSAPYTMLDDGVPTGTVLVNQQLAPAGEYADGVYWQSLGTFATTTNNFAVRLGNNANGYVTADAIRIVAGGIAPQEPEMDVAAFDRSILTGDVTPDMSDGTDFGFVPELTDSSVRRFTITNNGNADLHLTGAPRVTVGGLHAADFIVMTQPASVVAPGRTTFFEVLFHPFAAGPRTALLSIANDDDTEHPYLFMLQGTGMGAAPLAHNAALPQDVNGDARVSAQDVMVVINHLLRGPEAAPLAATAQVAAESASVRYIDVNADGRVSAVDALMVINYLLRRSESAPAAPTAASPMTSAAVEAAFAAPDADELADSTLARLDPPAKKAAAAAGVAPAPLLLAPEACLDAEQPDDEQADDDLVLGDRLLDEPLVG